MLSFLQVEGGGCSAQKTQQQCENMLSLWDATNGKDGNACSFCTLPRKYGGPKYACIECSSISEPEKRNWECTIDATTCTTKKPTPPPPPPEETKAEPHVDYYDSVDDNDLTESIIKGVTTAGVTELANKLHVRYTSINVFEFHNL
jgi:hypothetical protein